MKSKILYLAALVYLSSAVAFGAITYTRLGQTQTIVNAQTGTTYTMADLDRGKVVTFSNTSAVAVTLPRAGASGLFLSGWYAWVQNKNSGAVTITPTTSTINGAATLVLQQNGGAFIVSDGTNYQITTLNTAPAVYKRMQTPSSGAQNGSNKTFVWEAFASATETLFINGVAIDVADYTPTASTGTIVLGASVPAPVANDQLRLSYNMTSGAVADTTIGVVVGRSDFVGDGSTVAFTAGAGCKANGTIYVSLNGDIQQISNYSVAGAVLTMTTAPISSAKLSWACYVSTPTSVSQKIETFTGDGATTDFTLAQNPIALELVSTGGLVQATTAYSLVSPNIVRYVTAPISSATVTISYTY